MLGHLARILKKMEGFEKILKMEGFYFLLKRPKMRFILHTQFLQNFPQIRVSARTRIDRIQ